MLGDAAVAVRFAAVVDVGAQAGVAHQVFGAGEAGDVAHRRQDDHRRDEANARQLYQDQRLCGLRGDSAEARGVIRHDMLSRIM